MSEARLLYPGWLDDRGRSHCHMGVLVGHASQCERSGPGGDDHGGRLYGHPVPSHCKHPPKGIAWQAESDPARVNCGRAFVWP
jgi:hypothetical protein